MPENISKAFDKRFGYSLENILDAVYNKPHPNQFLSSFSKFVGDHSADPFIQQIIERNFRDFFVEQVTKYTGYKDIPVGVIGSVGFHFQEIFKKVAEEFGVKVGEIIQAPILGLVRYHST
jgi:glucosamine kinase